MLKQIMTTSEAANLLLKDDNANWTYQGAHAIAEYLEELSDDCGEDIDFCHVEVRIEFSEYTASDLVYQYGYLLRRDLPSDENWVSNCSEAMEELTEAAEEYIVASLENGNFIVRDC